jgi:hypothetical protein
MTMKRDLTTADIKEFCVTVNEVMALALDDDANGIEPRRGIEICREVARKWWVGHEKYLKATYDLIQWHRRKSLKASTP